MIDSAILCPSRIDRQWMTASVIDGRISPPAGAIVWSEKTKEHGETSRWRGVPSEQLGCQCQKKYTWPYKYIIHDIIFYADDSIVDLATILSKEVLFIQCF